MNNFLRIFFYLFLPGACCIFFNGTAVSQNLVPNPSFEQHDTCPESPSHILYAKPWFQPTWGTPDYFNSCDISNYLGVPQNFIGYQNANSGVAYAGLFVAYPWEDIPPNPPIYREYIETKLLDSLNGGTKYYIDFYISLSDSSRYATDDLGVYFSKDTAQSDTSYQLHFTPQFSNLSGSYCTDKIGWIKISGTYIAQGGEKFITIGNFKNNINTDTIPTIGGGNGSSDFYNAYYYIDDICVSSDSTLCDAVGIAENNYMDLISISPNPSSGLFDIDFSNFYSVSARIYDIYGRSLHIYDKIEGQHLLVNLSDQIQGTYFMIINTEKSIITLKLFIIKP